MCHLFTEYCEYWLSCFCVIVLANKLTNERQWNNNLLGGGDKTVSGSGQWWCWWMHCAVVSAMLSWRQWSTATALWYVWSRLPHILHQGLYPVTVFLSHQAPCGLRGCKNRPTPFPGRMSYKVAKPGLAVFMLISISVLGRQESMFFIVLLFIRAPFYVLLVFIVCVLSFGCSS